ncbi:hypothetical protein [Phytohabitans kaempferiae]|uniref:Uncharacterized protein n=1 Tax=Phytohabitans kaempferiae TaxID=1620943 RepID=A0ABV6LZ99_9ACTN
MADFPLPPPTPRDRDDGGDPEPDGLLDLVRQARNHDAGAIRLSYDLDGTGYFDLVRDDPESTYRC